MKSNIFTLMAFVGLVGGVTLACSGDESGGDCDGEELCACVSGNLCLSGLVCSNGTCIPDAGSTTNGTDTTDTTDSGGGGNAEDDACARANECNLLEAGVSAMDCADENRQCTQDLLSSEYSDWTKEVEDCLEFANCKNFQSCITELSACPPIDPPSGGTGGDTCVTDGNPCDFCWFDEVCPDIYLGGDDGCDCGCSNGADSDCG